MTNNTITDDEWESLRRERDNLVLACDARARERDEAIARAERAEANLVDLTPMVADCETLRTLAAAQSKEITRLRFALDATGAERDNAEGRVARLTGEVERHWECMAQTIAEYSAAQWALVIAAVDDRNLPALEAALGIAGEGEEVKP